MKAAFFLLFIVNSAYAQTYRFFYDLTIRKPTDTLTIGMVLDIDKNITKFYDEDFLRIDSLNLFKKSKLQTKSSSDQLILRKTNGYKNKQYYTHVYDYFVIETNDKILWKLEDEIKKNGEITLQKATTHFGGRDWIAWFDKTIPFQEGPYKFNGLAGLIYEVYDSDNVFHYSLVKNINLVEPYDTNDFLETHYGKKPIQISLKQYQKLKIDYYNNIVEILKEFSKKGGEIAFDQDLSSSEEIEKKRKILQHSIKSHYLPIEIDKSIPYP